MARRLALLVALAALAAAAAPESGRAALFFLFEPTSAKPGETVTVRLGGTPKAFTRAQAVRPFQRAIRLYLAPNGTVQRLRTRFDARLHFIATLTPDARGRGKISFTVPPLDGDAYAVAAWCPGCARFSFGRTFFTLPVSSYTAARYPMLLNVRPPSSSATCPVTVPNGSTPPGEHRAAHFHGNGLLWTGLAPDRPIGRLDEDGSYFDKLLWTTILYETLTLRAVRLDATAPPARWKANEGGSAGSWATAVWFSSAGCWRLTARVGDVSLSVVVRVGDA
ncbi:MAG: hypothetical protein H0V68_10100 [Actinobacteria bacterium]|nr:hypothetical protein [Actinomycetota bacterium]